MRTQDQINGLCNLLEECVDSEVETEVFLKRARQALHIEEPDWLGRSSRGEGARSILETLYRRLAPLHDEELSGIWILILQNASMPLFVGEFDFVAGNPPWINWQSLPSVYKTRVVPLWDSYALFPHTGFQAILGSSNDDIPVLMTYVITDSLLRNGGRLGFLITQSVFKTAGAEKGLRRFRYGTDKEQTVCIESVDDLVDFQPLEGASNRTSAFFWRKAELTKYPVTYRIWHKTVQRQSIDKGALIPEVLSLTRQMSCVALPVNSDENT